MDVERSDWHHQPIADTQSGSTVYVTGLLPEAPRRIFRLWGRHGGPILVLRATQSARGCVPWIWNDQDVDTGRWATRCPDQWSLPAPHWSARARCERYRSRLEYKLIPCGFLHWDGLQASGGSLATVNITLRRYLTIRPPPTPQPSYIRLKSRNLPRCAEITFSPLSSEQAFLG